MGWRGGAEGQGGGNPGVMGAGRLRDVGGEEREEGLPEASQPVVQLWTPVTQQQGETLKHYTIFHNRKSTQRWVPLWKGMETGIAWYEKHEV